MTKARDIADSELGSLTVDTDTLVVDETNNRVGIGTSSPSAALDVASDAVIHNLTVGRGAGAVSTNTANGRNALSSNTTGSRNTANGRNTLSSNDLGSNNTANGYEALKSNTTGGSNVANGSFALFGQTTGNNNVAIGQAALFDKTTGDQNIAIGRNAGRGDSPFQVTTQSNRIIMGNDNHTDAYIKVSWTVTSDARDKTGFAPVPHGLDFIKAIDPTEYQFRAGGRDSEQGDGKRRYGFLAQEILEVEGTDSVIVDAEDPEKLKLKENYLLPVLVNAVKDLSAQVEELKTEINKLKG